MRFEITVINYPASHSVSGYYPKSGELVFGDEQALENFLNDKHPEFTSAVVVTLPAKVGSSKPEEQSTTVPLLTDAERLDWLEKQAKKSITGVSFDWIPSLEGERSGWRYMHYHYIGEPGSSLRKAIDSVMRIFG
jgi:hypothetical protein